ncbi:16S rRNA (guanine(527)-N(7))-methyltransferase RsmG [Pelistega sp. NLN82]|uniref:Ribosomal RNA small subunit methyltransferase G n=1 Tax=Pelistega ratti TaxID=2652177 RepID=A0A6L9Y8C3_9BURK|nr:16S rRNA (guanine(527)-N(7))-methyltransferase RsmG [Pelistega ratti]NEN76639.1 16S rRNA (guanine(527)-N(7))-methyltransferase RsmG [Pelistega ratti]
MDTIIQQRLDEGAKSLGLVLSQEEKQRLLSYMNLLKRWNKTYNLTALKTDEQILIHHLLDSLSVVLPLRKSFSNRESVRVLDVGSGGGLPGVVLAIMNPTWQVECIDAVEKKTSFILQVAGILGLKNLKSKHIRIENYSVEPVDLVISRAFASLADFANLAGKHVAHTGSLVAMKGHYLEEEIEELHAKSLWKVASYLPIEVPQLEAERCLIYLKQKGI